MPGLFCPSALNATLHFSVAEVACVAIGGFIPPLMSGAGKAVGTQLSCTERLAFHTHALWAYIKFFFLFFTSFRTAGRPFNFSTVKGTQSIKKLCSTCPESQKMSKTSLGHSSPLAMAEHPAGAMGSSSEEASEERGARDTGYLPMANVFGCKSVVSVVWKCYLSELTSPKESKRPLCEWHPGDSHWLPSGAKQELPEKTI